MRDVLKFNKGWKWHDGDIKVTSSGCSFSSDTVRLHLVKTGNHGVSMVGYNDSDWENVTLPHDFVSWRGAFDEAAEPMRGNLVTGVGWYRKTFILSKKDSARLLSLEFDGVFRDSEVWVNGHFVKKHMSGYTGFSADISDVAVFGGENTVAVRADASEQEGWWYEGGGIYRNVRLIKKHPLHIPMHGVFIKPELDEKMTTAHISVSVEYHNCSEEPQTFEIMVSTDDVSIREMVQVEPYGEGKKTLHLALVSPRLWNLDNPNLYTADIKLMQGDIIRDNVSEVFGIRSCVYDADRGLLLNGTPVKVKGFCCHEGHASVGTAIPYELHEYRLQKLKAIGANSIRAAHAPPDPEFLNACDRLGVLVLEETRLMNSSNEYICQLESMIRRDRNHPSVIIWSLGNEETAVQGTVIGAKILKRLIRTAHALDSSRPTTCAISGYWIEHTDVYTEHGAFTDIIGLNYNLRNQWDKYDEIHARNPSKPILITETGAMLSVRGTYHRDRYPEKLVLPESAATGIRWGCAERKGLITGYGDTCPDFACTAEEIMTAAEERPYLMGLFYWSGFDYRGETMPYRYPSLISRYGVYDYCGIPKDLAWYFKSCWSSEPIMHILPHWTWPGMEGQEIEVWAYTNADEIEFFLNGVLLNRSLVRRHGYVTARVAYEKGCLEAVGYKKGKKFVSSHVETAGAPNRIVLNTHTHNVQSGGVAIIDLTVVDKRNIIVPYADITVQFDVQGGEVLGVGNGNHESQEPEHSRTIKTHNGHCQAVVRAGDTGIVKVYASSRGTLGDCVDISVIEGV